MEYINIDGTDLKSSVLGLGGDKIAALSRDKNEVVATLNEALDRGINLFDTAAVYSYGDSEKLLGQIVRGRRDKVIICSKAGHTHGRAQLIGKFLIPAVKRIVRNWKPLRTTAVSAIGAVRGGANYQPGYIAKSIENSLRRLGTDYLDMFLIHGAGPDDIADGALVDKLERLKDKGMIRYYGVSCARAATPDDVRALLKHKTMASLRYHLTRTTRRPWMRPWPASIPRTPAWSHGTSFIRVKFLAILGCDRLWKSIRIGRPLRPP